MNITFQNQETNKETPYIGSGCSPPRLSPFNGALAVEDLTIMTTKEISYNTGAALRKLRSIQNINQKAVSDQTGILRSTYSRMESNYQKLTIYDIFKIADFYGIKASELVCIIEMPCEEMNKYIISLNIKTKAL